MQREVLYETPQISIGLVIGTYGAVVPVHLHLESWNRNYPRIDVLLHDDNSPQQDHLHYLCRAYGADFTCRNRFPSWMIGDLAAFVAGLNWAKAKGFDLLVKFSRRFIPLYDWVPELQELAFITQYATFGSYCLNSEYVLRPECVALNVSQWFESGAVQEMLSLVESETPLKVETLFASLVKKVHSGNCKYNQSLESIAPKPPHLAGYGHWLLPGIGKMIRRPRILWHNSHSPQEYIQQAHLYNLPYSLSDFQIAS